MLLTVFNCLLYSKLGRLERIITKHPNKTNQEFLEAVLAVLDLFINAQESRFDITIIADDVNKYYHIQNNCISECTSSYVKGRTIGYVSDITVTSKINPDNYHGIVIINPSGRWILSPRPDKKIYIQNQELLSK